MQLEGVVGGLEGGVGAGSGGTRQSGDGIVTSRADGVQVWRAAAACKCVTDTWAARGRVRRVGGRLAMGEGDYM